MNMSNVNPTDIQANNLILRTVNSILSENYYIPAYQRGYRWTETQVLQLLDDINSFKVIPAQDGSEPFYCLQPVVVKKNGDLYEVIDGQQRLTTIAIFIRYYNIFYSARKKLHESSITYDTRKTSASFIKSLNIVGPEEYDPTWDNMELEQALTRIEISCDEYNEDDNIDFFHMARAFKAIHYWFLKQEAKGDFSPSGLCDKMLLNSKVIWYEVEDSKNNNSVDIFTRLNIGKIPLTNGELIKALFLMTGNFSPGEVTLRQIQIASEWDTIEKALQDDDFWFFIYNPSNPIRYENRIEYIFDLMKGRTLESESYHTFNAFHVDFESKRAKDGKADIDAIWLSVKRKYLTIDEWFRDYELYHYIGFLISCSDNVQDRIENLLRLSKNDKDAFKSKLKEEIHKLVPVNYDELEYGDKETRQVLLLFNIATVLQTRKSDMRFPFNKFKNEDWDIEHVSSQTDKEISDDTKIREWADDILDYFIGTKEKDDIDAYLVRPYEGDDEKEKQDLCRKICSLKSEKKIDPNAFQKVYSEMKAFFKEDKPLSDKHSIANLALLDSNTNRSYGNAFFPIKRKRIIDNDSKGIFVPIATKNLFLKYYSRVSDNLMYWTAKDADDYLGAIRRVLDTFFNSTSNE